MSDDRLSGVSITTPEEFEEVLAAAVESAVEAGVDIRGAWEFQTRGSKHNWDVEIVELATDLDDD
jgi:hypothetical protein